MKHVSVLFAIVVYSTLSAPLVQAEDLPVTGSNDTALEDVTSEGLVEEELPLLEGDEGEVSERGVRRFKLKPRKRMTIPKNSIRPGITIPKPQSNNPPSPPPTGGTKNPPVDDGGGQGQPVPPPPSQCVIQTSDIIDPRIENGDIGDGNTTMGAQGSLMRVMQHGSVEERRAASSIIMAVKSGQLAGVHAPDMARKVLVDRAASLPPIGTIGYWNLLAPGQVGLCLREPAGVPPMLLYRQKNMPPGAVEHTLVTEWPQCDLPTLPSPCTFVMDLHKPPPPSGSMDNQEEGSGELQVLVKGEGKALQGVQVSVRAIRKESSGHENYQGEFEPEKQLMLVHFTNGQGIAAFIIPPVQNRISVQVNGPPGFYNHTSEFGFLPKDTKGISVELEPIPLSGPGS